MIIPPAPHSGSTLVLRRAFTASRQRVFRAWIEPAALESWLRPGGKGVTVRSLDARVGGSFRFDLENGGSIVGTYLHIVPRDGQRHSRHTRLVCKTRKSFGSSKG